MVKGRHIGIDARPLSAELTGIGFYFLNILKVLSDIDEDNHYFLFSDNDFPMPVDNPRWHKCVDKRPACIPSSIWLFFRGGGVVKKYKLDVLWSPWPLLTFGTSVKTVITVHDFVWIYCPQTMRRDVYWLYKVFGGYSIKIANKLLCVSKTTMNDLKKLYPNIKGSMHITYNAVADSFRVIDKPEAWQRISGKYDLRRPFILHVGTLQPRKNLIRLIKAFDLMCSLGTSDVDLVLTGGKGWRDKNFFNELDLLKYKDRIKLTGYVDTEDLPYFYNSAKFLIFPSFYEGFGMPILEAMACGCPVLTSSVSSMLEVGGNAVLFFDPMNIEDISQKMNIAVKDASVCDDLVRKGFEQVRKFSWRDSASTVLFSLNNT